MGAATNFPLVRSVGPYTTVISAPTKLEVIVYIETENMELIVRGSSGGFQRKT
jgi:hypothetical protein